MEKKKGNLIPLSEASKGRDELNFAEFPLALLSDRAPGGQKTLSFSDSIYDAGCGEVINRRLTISASDKYGLPTALDQEVIVGLMQLSKKVDFSSPTVHFTRYELLKALGWRIEGKSYERIEESLKRWLGVTLYYDKAWWSKEEKCWVSENFHILEQVTVLDRNRQRARAKKETPLNNKSSFVWNAVVYRSFQEGYLKELNMDFFRDLKSSVSKQIFRFLDKRFYHRRRLEFDLKEFALEHIGLSKKYHTGEIKRRLRPAIAELEDKGFLKALDDKRRFRCVKRGVWRICFEKAEATDTKTHENVNDELCGELIAHGVSRTVAARLVNKHKAEHIKEKLEIFNYLKTKTNYSFGDNPAGFLVSAIKDDYAAPNGFLSKNDIKKRKEKVKVADDIKEKREATFIRQGEDKKIEEQVALKLLWKSFTKEKQNEIERLAVSLAAPFLATQYKKEKGRGGPLFKVVREQIILDYLKQNEEERKSA